MVRWLLFLLLVLDLGVFVWGWRSDGSDAPPPLAEGPVEIRLISELPPPAIPDHSPQPTAAAESAPAPVSAYDRGAVQPGTSAHLPTTTTERVDPGLLPDELLVEPPVVIPPVREDDEGVRHTWSR